MSMDRPKVGDYYINWSRKGERTDSHGQPNTGLGSGTARS